MFHQDNLGPASSPLYKVYTYLYVCVSWFHFDQPEPCLFYLVVLHQETDVLFDLDPQRTLVLQDPRLHHLKQENEQLHSRLQTSQAAQKALAEENERLRSVSAALTGEAAGERS